MRRPDGFDAPAPVEQQHGGRPERMPRLLRGRRDQAQAQRSTPTTAARGGSGAEQRSSAVRTGEQAGADRDRVDRDRVDRARVDPARIDAAGSAASGDELPPVIPIDRPVAARVRPARTAAEASKRADRALRRAEVARRRYERNEMRRFTRSSRRRRAIWLTIGGAFALLLVAVAVAVFSPALALKTVRVEGAVRVDALALQARLDEQLGTPLALVDEGRIIAALEQFPLIRSFVIERLPPDAIVVRINEREPLAALVSGEGYELVDPAGVSVLTSATPVDGVPAIDLRGQGVDSVAFTSVVEVLLAMPVELRARVVQVSAVSRDDVTLSLSGVGQTVAWGSADDSALKARVLAALMATVDPGRAGQFDVSAPTIAIFRPA